MIFFPFLGYSGDATDNLYYKLSNSSLNIGSSNSFVANQTSIIHPSVQVKLKGYD